MAINIPWNAKHCHHVIVRLAVASLGLLASAAGDVTFSLHFDPNSSNEARQVANSVTNVAAFYNRYGSFNKHWNVYHNPGIPTAEGNYDGYMGYGGIRNERVVFHEGAHTFGMGTHGGYFGLIAGGVWRGRYANQEQFDTYNNYPDGLHGDNHAIWPGGFNYDNEDGYIERFWQMRIMAGMRTDLGVLSFMKEPKNEAVMLGDDASFHVEAPLASSWRWLKDDQELADGGRISGAGGPTLRIAAATTADAGNYRCRITGAGETLLSRPRKLVVHPQRLLAHWNFDQNLTDTVAGHSLPSMGGGSYVASPRGHAIALHGNNQFLTLPEALGNLRDFTIATWVKWDGGGDWQRIFDFGTNEWQYLFLTPRASGAGLRLALKDAIREKNTEFVINAPVLPKGRWVHLAVVAKRKSLTLYVDGRPVGDLFNIPTWPADFLEHHNYLGKSQFPADPAFAGQIDDVKIYCQGLSGAEIWALWGQGNKAAPDFETQSLSLPEAKVGLEYEGVKLADMVNNPSGAPLQFAILHGPAWLTTDANGNLAGRPDDADAGDNEFVVRVSSPEGASSETVITIPVASSTPVPVTHGTAAPPRQPDDLAFLPGPVEEALAIGGGDASGSNDEFTYLATDRSAKGQSFTTGPHTHGYALESFTLQHVQWPNPSPHGTSFDIRPGDRWTIEIGSLKNSVKSPLIRHTSFFDGTSLTGTALPLGTGRYLTFNLSGLGIHLKPDQEYYFEAAPATGAPFFELHSQRGNPYEAGSAFRGQAAGNLDDQAIMLDGDFAFHASLLAARPQAAHILAYWDFEEGSSNAAVPYNRTSAGQYEGSIRDRSGNANHLSVWEANWHVYRRQVPATTTPQTGAPNKLVLQNLNNYPVLTTVGTSLKQWSPVSWTLECAIRPSQITNNVQTFIGRDSRGASPADPKLATLYFAILPEAKLRILFVDSEGHAWTLDSAADTVRAGQWQAVAASSDGNTLSLYLKNITRRDNDYTLLGTLDISSSANPAIHTGLGSGGDWQAGNFSVARGLYDGGHTDRFIGFLDDIRFADTALSPASFLYSQPPVLNDYATWAAGFPDLPFGAEGPEADPDGDGIPNAVESLFGTDPTRATPGLELESPLGNGSYVMKHPVNPTPPEDYELVYQWSKDLTNWQDFGVAHDGVTVTLGEAWPNEGGNGLRAKLAISDPTPSRIFIRAKAVSPQPGTRQVVRNRG